MKNNKLKIVIPIVAVLAIIALVVGIFVGRNVLIKNSEKAAIDKEAGFEDGKTATDYITLGKTSGFKYTITQKQFDESVREETDTTEDVDRPAQDGDIVEVKYTGYLDGKKEKDISAEGVSFTLGKDKSGAYKRISDAVLDKKTGDKFTVKLSAKETTEISTSKKVYKKGSELKGKVVSVGELKREKVTDKWVKETYGEEGLKTTKDFYGWIEHTLEDDAKTEIWTMCVKDAKMSSYPQKMYDDVVEEFNNDASYNADYYGYSLEEYLYDFSGYTKKTLEEAYIQETKSELVMWAIAEDQLFAITNKEIEDKYEELYEECGYDSVEAMKKDYKVSEIREAIYADKAEDYVYDNSTVTKAYKIPTK